MTVLMLVIAGGSCGYLLVQAIDRRAFALGLVAMLLFYYVGIVGTFAFPIIL
jgi:hypothetical protein